MTILKRIDLRTAALDQRRLRMLAAKAGGVDALFSRRSVKFRGMGFKDRKLTEKDLLDLMASEYTMIRRPVLELETRAIVGFQVKAYKELLERCGHAD